MRVLVVHNYYRLRGGEDQAFESECDLLRRYGHEVYTMTTDNAEVSTSNPLQLLSQTVWNRSAHNELASIVGKMRAQIVHFHNTFPRLSFSCYSAARTAGAAVVQTLHNYRLLCPGATFLRAKAPCEDCLGRTVAWPALLHSCYRDSRRATAATVSMLVFHKLRKTWDHEVDVFIPLTEFARNRFVAGGLAEEKLHVKPNFLAEDDGPGPGDGGYALYVGRLSEEKGLRTVLSAWRDHSIGLPLNIVGEGPLGDLARRVASELPSVNCLGQVSRSSVLGLMRHAFCLILPSQCYENLPLTLVEAFAAGVPVVASRIGSLATLVADGETGLLFDPGAPNHLASSIRRLIANPSLVSRLRAGARSQFESQYTASANYVRLKALYERALEIRKADRASAPSSSRGSV